MPVFSPQALAQWTGGRWTVQPTEGLSSVYHDTRTLKKGALYVALPGERIDGHALLDKAKAAGASAALCLKGKSEPFIPCLEVEDTGKALEEIAKGYRRTLHPKRMIGVTGSAGKTTVKDFISLMLSKAGPTCSTQGNWNNFVGLPLSLLAMESTDEFGVFELGMNHAGEIASLAEIVQPDMGVITSIGEAHLEQLGSVEAIAEEKTSLLSFLPENGQAILDLDSDWYSYSKSRCACQMTTVSVDPNSAADLLGEILENEIKIYDRKRSEEFSVPLPLPGEHMAKNLLQAVALVRECGLTSEQIVTGLSTYQAAPMRWQHVTLNSRQFINDAYNANPLSMRKSIQTFSEVKHSGEKWLVLGGMAELGAEEITLHKHLGHTLDAYGFNGVILFGKKGEWIASGMENTPVMMAGNHDEAVGFVEKQIPENALVLLKGSRSERIETILQKLQKIEEGKL